MCDCLQSFDAVKNWVVGCWCACLSGARCRLPQGPADATDTHCLLLQYNPDWFCLLVLAHLGSPGQRVIKRVYVYVCNINVHIFAAMLFIGRHHSLPQWLCIHTHTRLTALCPGLRGWAGTRKVKPIWILLKQETVSGSGISWAISKPAPRSRQITTPAPHHSVFYRPDALPAAQPTASKHWRHRSDYA